MSYDKILISSLTLPAFSYTPVSLSSSSSSSSSSSTTDPTTTTTTKPPPSTIDCWSKPRPQPTSLSVFLHLVPRYLDACADTDDVTKSVHYGILTKRILSMVGDSSSNSNSSSSVEGGSSESPNTPHKGFTTPNDLITRIASESFALSLAAAQQVQIIMDMPKFILLADGFSIDAIVPFSHPRDRDGVRPGDDDHHLHISQKRISIKDLTIPVIIGVNPPERLSKQRVIVNITITEDVSVGAGGGGDVEEVDYQKLVKDIYETLSQTTYLTLEKFALHIVRIACLFSPRIQNTSVRAQKPSALSWADSSGVEVCRPREVYL